MVIKLVYWVVVASFVLLTLSEPRDATARAIPALFHLQQSLPKRVESLEHGVLQVRETLLPRVHEILQESDLEDSDMKEIHDIISKIQTQLFGASLENLKLKVNEVAKTSLQYDCALTQCENEVLTHIQTMECMLAPEVHRQPERNRDGCCFQWFGKTRDFPDLKSSFLHRSAKPTPPSHRYLPRLMDMKNMGSHAASYLKGLQEDLEVFQEHQIQFQQLCEQIVHFFQSRHSFAGRAMDSSKLSMVLMEWDLPECAELMERKKISTKFFELMSLTQLQEIGIQEALTLQRVLQVQAERVFCSPVSMQMSGLLNMPTGTHQEEQG